MREPSAIMTAADKKEQIRNLKADIKMLSKEIAALQKKLDVLAPPKPKLAEAA